MWRHEQVLRNDAASLGTGACLGLNGAPSESKVVNSRYSFLQCQIQYPTGGCTRPPCQKNLNSGSNLLGALCVKSDTSSYTKAAAQSGAAATGGSWVVVRRFLY